VALVDIQQTLMKKKDPHGRLARWSYEMQSYDMKVLHRPGQENQNADALSRTPLPSIRSIMLVKKEKIQNDLILAQRNDKFCQEIIRMLEETNKKDSNNFRFDNEGILIRNEGKILVPKEKIREILELNHDHMLAGHLGIAKTLVRVKRQFVWHGLGKDVTEYVNN
jgi:Integrase zinc binding domain